MKIVFTEPFKSDYKNQSPEIQRALDKALGFLLVNPHHPSLHVKKLPGTNIWYARISRAYRFTFNLEGDTITLRRAGAHDVLNKERKK